MDNSKRASVAYSDRFWAFLKLQFEQLFLTRNTNRIEKYIMTKSNKTVEN